MILSFLTLFIGIYFLGALGLFACRNSSYYRYRLPVLTYLMSIHLFGKALVDILRLGNYEGFNDLTCLHIYWLNRITFLPFLILYPACVVLFVIVYRSHLKSRILPIYCKLFNLPSDRTVIQIIPWYVYLAIWVVSFCLPILVYLIDLAAGLLNGLDKMHPVQNQSVCTGPTNISWTVINVLACVGDIVIFIKLRHEDDGFGIRWQLRLMSVIHIPLFIIYFIFANIFYGDVLLVSTNSLFIFLYEFFQICIILFCPIIFFLKFKYNIYTLKPKFKQDIDDMQRFLDQPTQRRIFYRYCSKRFATNYILFLEKFEQLKKCKSPAVYKIKSEELCKDFILPNGCYFIKVPQDMVVDFTKYKSDPRQIWEVIANHIKGKVLQDLFMPFMSENTTLIV
eukprot:NODE_22_length_42145_cov_1.310612.p10 type:complete len:395 gc:universal NODE_22_length_42145_cov_1.310612:13104-11920(-)